jgi:hypothetical protein
MKHVIILVLAIYATFHLMVFNDYMHYKSVRAEVVTKEMVAGASNKTKLTITYKREDDRIFKLPANAAEWQSAVPGEQRWVSARPIDVQPNLVDTTLHTVAPLIVMMFTLLYLLWFLLCFSWSTPQENKFVQPSTKGPLEK